MSTESQLRARMTAYASDVTPAGPDLAAAAATARRQRRARGGAVVGVTVAVVALAAVGVGTATSHRADRIRPAARRDTTGAPLPGFARAARVTVPSNLDVFAAAEADGQVWVVGSDPSNNEPILLHAADGQTLQEVHRYPYGDVSDERLAIRGGHAIVVSTENDVSGSPEQDAELTVYDDRSTAVLRSVDLTTAYGVAGAALVSADGDGGPLAIVLAGRGSAALTQQLRAGVVGADGGISDLTPAIELRASPLELGAPPYQPEFSQMQLIVTAAGRPRYVFVEGASGRSLRRLDLLTGLTATVFVDAQAPADGSGTAPTTVGVLAGRVLIQTAHGLVEGLAADDDPATVAGSTRLGSDDVPSPSLLLVDGRPYEIVSERRTETARALLPSTLQPYGPAVTTLPGTIAGQDGVVFTRSADALASGLGGTLTAYTPS